MATKGNFGFQDLLNEYLPNRMLTEELIKRDWFLSNIEIDNGWTGGRIPVPFKGATASTVEFGRLASSDDISSSKYVRGYLDNYKEAWATLVFSHTDLQDMSGKIPEATFLNNLLSEVDSMVDYFKQVVSTQLGNGRHFAKITLAQDPAAVGAAIGKVEVDHIDRFTLGQKFELVDTNSPAQAYYVVGIDVNAATASASTGSITLSLDRGGAPANVSAYTVDQEAKCYHPGAITESFTSIREVLLPASAGGSLTVHGQSKLAYPILQAVSRLSSDVTKDNILEKIFDFYTDVRKKAKGNASTVVMSFKHLGSVMKLLESQKGAFSVTKQPSASIYGWTEIEITTVKGTLKFAALLELDDDIIMFLDMNTMKFRTRGGFKRRKSPEGKEYFEQRTPDKGYVYIIDQCLFGELEISAPGHNGIMYGINY